MPSPSILQRFIARVEANAHAEACEEFYAIESSMRENRQAPRIGRAAHVAAEHAVMRARGRSGRPACARSSSTATTS